jgi:hypothetical protein
LNYKQLCAIDQAKAFIVTRAKQGMDARREYSRQAARALRGLPALL